MLGDIASGFETLTRQSMEVLGKGRDRESGKPPRLAAKRPSSRGTTGSFKVLYVNGCDKSVPTPHRYRVTHQREQLELLGIPTDEIHYTKATAADEYRGDAIVLFRCPLTDGVRSLIESAHAYGKQVYFDVDDLVIDTSYTDALPHVKEMSAKEKKVFDDGVMRMGETLSLCDGAIVSTDKLGSELSRYIHPILVNRNVASREMVACSKKAIDEVERQAGVVVLGYFSGSITHDKDFEVIAKPLSRLFARFSNLRLRVVGDCTLPPELSAFKKRLIKTPYVDWKELPKYIRSVDVNLAPLENTLFNEAKSENKWTEAALVGVPTVASDIGAFSAMIHDGETGFLCSSEGEWEDVLARLIENGAERVRAGEAARAYCLKHCTTKKTGRSLSEFLHATPRTVDSVVPKGEKARARLVNDYLLGRGFVSDQDQPDPEPWQSVPVGKRCERVGASREAGKKIAAILYDRAYGDSATFRYYGYNVSERLANSANWDAVYFFLDESAYVEALANEVDLLVMVRMRIRPELTSLVGALRQAGVVVAYMMDDDALGRVAAPRLVHAMASNIRDVGENEFWYGTAERFELASKLADCFIASTGYYAQVLEERYHKPAHVIGPSLNNEQVAIAQRVLSDRFTIDDIAFYIGYFSGTASHNSDFSLVEEPLLSFLDTHEDVRFLLVGHLEIDDELFTRVQSGQVIVLPRVDYMTLQYLQASVDVIVAPLQSDAFNDCKSGLKVFEAGVVGVPACASPTPSYREAVDEGISGYICSMKDDWAKAFEELYRNRPNTEMRIAARERALERYYGESVRSMIERAYDESLLSDRSGEVIAIPDEIGNVQSRDIDWDDQFQASVLYGKDELGHTNKTVEKRSRKDGKYVALAGTVVAKVQRDGIKSTFDAAKKKIETRRKPVAEEKDPDKVVFYDILFINGCDYSLPHPIRYRVTHQVEQLRAAGLSVDRVNAWKLKLSHVRKARAFIIYRCPYDAKIGKFIELAKRLNKQVYFDIDDLVVDRKYTDAIKYVDNMPPCDKALYDEGVDRMKRTLLECGSAITTTNRLANELETLVQDVYINRNTASEEMLSLSNQAYYERFELPYLPNDKLRKDERARRSWARREFTRQRKDRVVIGYFSGSITHNDDIDMVLPALVEVLRQRPHAELLIAGILDIPKELEPFRERVIAHEFCTWKKLPGMIVKADINIVPLVANVFNEAKSENKWVEAALVKVPTVASKVGAFQQMINDGETGLLCETPEDWRRSLIQLIDDESERKRIGQAAYDFCVANCTTVETGHHLAHYLKGRFSRNVFMAFPSLNTSGGVLVALDHCAMLQKNGYDVSIIDNSRTFKHAFIEHNGCSLPVIRARSFRNQKREFLIDGSVDVMVATMWTTACYLDHTAKVASRRYLVQGYETDFYEPPNKSRIEANSTYNNDLYQYLTVSKWCKGWLEERSGAKVRYAPNGIDLNSFPYRKRSFGKRDRVRILIEGSSTSRYKNVDEAFKIVDLLDPRVYEIWYMSYDGEPKPYYRVDKFLNTVPHEEVGEVYAECDILLKTSVLESFSYPPLEMMATGGFVVAIQNEGNAEYLVHGENCLLFDSGALSDAVASIELIVSNGEIRDRLSRNMAKTVESRDWNIIEPQILALYS